MPHYTPIPCDFHSHLESWAVTRTQVNVQWKSTTEEGLLSGVITDLYTKDKEEFMVIDHDMTIRLDYLISVNGLKLADFRGCKV